MHGHMNVKCIHMSMSVLLIIYEQNNTFTLNLIFIITPFTGVMWIQTHAIQTQVKWNNQNKINHATRCKSYFSTNNNTNMNEVQTS
jgi:hypothetical protein